MDKPTTPGGTGGGSFSWPEDSGSGEGFGATGAFGTLKLPEEPAPLPAKPVQAAEKAEPEKETPPTATARQRALGAMPLQEPVVHKVVFGSGGDESSTQLLDRIRMASAERASSAERKPAAEQAPAGSGGFTELLRSLGSQAGASQPGAPAQAARQPSAPVAQPEAPVSGFTSLLQSLNTPPARVSSAEKAKASLQADLQAVLPGLKPSASPAAPAPPAPAAPKPGGFTELLRMSEPEPSKESGFSGLDALPQAAPAPSEGNKPGTFTQLFGTFDSAEAGAPYQPPIEPPRPASPAAGPSSFTQLWSLEQQTAAPAPPVREESAPLPVSVDYARTPAPPMPSAPLRDPFAQTVPEALPAMPSAEPAQRVGLTDLIQMLDESPSPSAAAPVAPPPVASAGASPGLWTQAMASLEAPSAPPAPPASQPSWAAPPAPAAPQPPAPASFAQQGPSEVTRIFEASRMREMAMQGGHAAEGAVPAAAAQRAPAAPPAAPMPSFSAPPPPAFPGAKAMPPQPPPPAFPAGFAPPGGAIPPAPQPPPAKPPQPAPGKLQQFVPLMLAAIIVLLVVLLVTVVFLMKH